MAKLKYILIPILLIAGLLTGNPNGPFGDYTGAPLANGNPGNSCGYSTNCHSEINDNGGTLNVTVFEKGFSTDVSEFEAGKTYVVTVKVGGTTSVKYGFSSTILNPSRGKTGTTQNPGNLVKIITYNNRNIAEHDSPSLTGIFTFEWVAPATNVPDSVKIYSAGNASDGHHNKTGDQILNNVKKLVLKSSTAGLNSLKGTHWSACYSQEDNKIKFHEPADFVHIFDSSGKPVLSVKNASSIEISSLPQGVYIAHCICGSGAKSFKFFKR